MCRQCDNPDRPIQKYLDELRETIRKHGWVVQGVEDDRAPYSYTIGLHSRGLPELLVTGLYPEFAARFLNHLADDAVRGELFTPGERINFLGRPLVEIVEVEHPDAHMDFAIALGGPDVRAMQLVWPDDHGRWPWDAQWNDGRGRQPVLGVRHRLPDAG
jgi:Domain of unknown function (DUF4262)